MSTYYPKEYPFEGEMLTIREIAERIGVPKDTIRQRLNKGMPFERAFSPEDQRIVRLAELNDPIRVEYKGRKVTMAELSELTGIKRGTLLTRWRFGDRGEELWRPVQKKGGLKRRYARD